MSVEIESARLDWQAGHRRVLETRRDPLLAERLDKQVDALGAILRRRLGAIFTTAELVAVYGGAESWAYDASSEEGEEDEGSLPLGVLAMAVDAAFYLYARAAVDYEP